MCIKPKKKTHYYLSRQKNICSEQEILLRIHSSCCTGDVFGSTRCDCRFQLHTALSRLSKHPQGILIYLQQEGRDIGIENKVMVYNLQDHGLDTYEANRALGLEDDARNYQAAHDILQKMGVRK